jgi:hypothetical protein
MNAPEFEEISSEGSQIQEVWITFVLFLEALGHR